MSKTEDVRQALKSPPATPTEDARRSSKDRVIKCVVWDLDNTLWDGVLLEDERVTLRAGVADIIRELDSRGILQSIASKNEYTVATAKLKELGLHDYFLYPQINWNSKAAALGNIAAAINIGLDAIAFIDDQPFERDEVNHSLPAVWCLDAVELDGLLDRPEMMPRFITEDSKLRRLMYMSDIKRNQAEEKYIGPPEEFLASLGMRFTISAAREEDLKRAEELTVRTNQLNTTGYSYSYEQLREFVESKRHLLLTASLEDRYGSYGKIGLALVECNQEAWVIKLLLMSCRVMSRGVGRIMISHLQLLAKSRQRRLFAEFVSTDRNRMMYITYKFAGFREWKKTGEVMVLENDLKQIQPFPDYITVRSTP
jgi:FkbH-like protein